MKRLIVFLMSLRLLFAGDSGQMIMPLPDSTMGNLSDAIISVFLEERDVYLDENGNLQMNVEIYTYDKYDMVDISRLAVGDTISTHSGEVKVITKEQGETGTIFINGGLENGGFDLVTEEEGVFFERGMNDALNWYAVGDAAFSLSDDFCFTDNADLDQGELLLDSESFLKGEIVNFDFTPYNTTIRIEAGQIVEMNRRYIP